MEYLGWILVVMLIFGILYLVTINYLRDTQDQSDDVESHLDTVSNPYYNRLPLDLGYGYGYGSWWGEPWWGYRGYYGGRRSRPWGRRGRRGRRHR